MIIEGLFTIALMIGDVTIERNWLPAPPPPDEPVMWPADPQAYKSTVPPGCIMNDVGDLVCYPRD